MPQTRRSSSVTVTAIALLAQCCLAEQLVAQTTILVATLNSEQVGPYPADPDGGGTARLELLADEARLCYELRVNDIEPATSSHVHQGSPGRIGPIRLRLEPPTDGESSSCARIDSDFLNALVASPGEFYIDVHNAAFPGGAVRGQLGS
jgi:CHRD domain